jgi:hypothetical protein
LQAVAREDIKNPQQRIALDEVLQSLPVYTGNWYGRKEAKDDEHTEGEQDLRP